jgi:SAM-dependent methyltransferase
MPASIIAPVPATSFPDERRLSHKIAARLAAKLPRDRRDEIRFRLQRHAYRSWLAARIRNELDPPVDAPIPPVEVISETSGIADTDAAVRARPSVYLATAYSGAHITLRAAELAGVNIRTIGAMLDLGCGGGRYLRVWREMHGIRLVGADINPRQIEWASKNLPGIEFLATEPDPPLPFADKSFDLVSAASVFTHIPLQGQEPWLEEVHRVLRPGGVLVATLAGRGHTRIQLGEDRLDAEGAVELGPDDTGVSHASVLTRQLDIFQTRAEVVRVFGGGSLELVDYVPSPYALDVIVLRRPKTAS